MPKKQITTLSLIGRGQWGSNYISTIRTLPDCRLPDEYIKTRDYAELFQHPEIQGVIIATPTITHFAIARECLMRNHNLLIEKPITKTLSEALTLQSIHQDHPHTIVMVGHLLLYDPAYLELKKLLRMVGIIKNLSFTGLKSPVRRDMTPLEDWLPHPTYLFIDLLGREPKEVATKQTGDDTFHVDFHFDNNISGNVDIGWTWPERKREFVVSGTEGLLMLDSNKQKGVLSFEGRTSQKQQWEISADQSTLALEVSEFLKCITTGKKSKTGVVQGIQVMKIIECAKQSLVFDSKYVKITK